ncbi:MAG: hypothetical protein ACJ8CB_20950 [Ktedonobacteraceae bacterium]
MLLWHILNNGTESRLSRSTVFRLRQRVHLMGAEAAQDGRFIMTEGCSGGPWMISSNGAFGYVNGHNDFRPTSDPGHMYSPYYDSGWFTVFNTAQNA